MIFLSLLLAWLIGVGIVAWSWPREQSLRADLALILPLGSIIGLFATSVLFFFVTLITERPAWYSAGIESVAAAALLWQLAARWQREPRVGGASVGTRGEWLLPLLFMPASLVAGIVAWRTYQAEPLGGWDGWAIWNMHARFMLRAGSDWPELLVAPSLSWTHPDYPRLIPASVARMWAWAGNEDPSAPALVSVVFAGATVALLVAVLARLRGRSVALVSGIVLLATPFFVTFAANEHADIPLGTFMLAALVGVIAPGAAQARGGAVLAGLCAAGAAWTKNEGLLFAAAFAAALMLHLWRGKAFGSAKRFLVALAIGLIPVVYFKVQLAPANDLISASAGSWVEKIADPTRHATILASFGRDLARFGEWQIAPWLALALPFAAWRARRRFGPAELLVPVLVGVMLVGYYAVYLVSPQNLAWHIDNSLVRLLLQLWPLTILAWGLAVPDFAASWTEKAAVVRWVSNRGIFAGASMLVAVGVIAGLSQQRGSNELAVRRFGLGEVSVALDEGWFPIERHGRDEWSWSSGDARLRLNVSGAFARVVTLRFEIGTAGPRTVVIRAGDRELWRGVIRDQRSPVTVAGLTLPPGTTTIEFTTDTAGVNEAPAAGGRTLAFGIFNLRLE
ncbi:MAG TPA: glycosyltransferase family 39 protein [Opitutaceae bacterium]|nr:glycosyltransferase family 39 protein [Opitutaceae bacterium]